MDRRIENRTRWAAAGAFGAVSPRRSWSCSGADYPLSPGTACARRPSIRPGRSARLSGLSAVRAGGRPSQTYSDRRARRAVRRCRRRVREAPAPPGGPAPEHPQLKVLDLTPARPRIATARATPAPACSAFERTDRTGKEVTETSYGLLKSQGDLDIRRRLHDQNIALRPGACRPLDIRGELLSRPLAAAEAGQLHETPSPQAQQASRFAAVQRLTFIWRGASSLDAWSCARPCGRAPHRLHPPARPFPECGRPVARSDSEAAYN